MTNRQNLILCRTTPERISRVEPEAIPDIGYGETDSELSSNEDEEYEEEEHPTFVKLEPSTTEHLNEWKTWEAPPSTPDLPQFVNKPGPTIEPPDNIVDFVKIFLTDELIDLIVMETNRYADQFISKFTLTKNARAQNWKPVTSEVSTEGGVSFC